MQLYVGFKSLFFILIVYIGAIQSIQAMDIVPSLCQPLSNIFSSLSSLLTSSPTNQKSKKPHTQRLESNKNDFEQILNTLKNDNLPKENTVFEEKIRLSAVSLLLGQDYDLSFFRHHIRPFFSNTIDKNSTSFLLCCYYQKYHSNGDKDDIHNLLQDKNLLTKCKEAQVDGYSALGAAIAAKDISIESKRRFIQELMNHGFELTEKDETLAIAEFYDEIPNDQKVKTVRLLLGQGNLSVLPHDVRRYIAYSMIDTCREQAWPLPDFSIPGQ